MNLQATLPNQKYQNFNKEALFAIYFYIFFNFDLLPDPFTAAVTC